MQPASGTASRSRRTLVGYDKRTLVGYAVALDVVVIATGAALILAPHDPFLLFIPFLAGIALAAWVGAGDSGLVATGLALIALVLQFPEAIDTTRLTVFAAAGSAVSLLLSAARTAHERFTAAIEPAPAKPFTLSGPLLLGLPLLAVILYANLSDVAMRNYPVPSLLQPLIVLLGFAVWKLRGIVHPSRVFTQPLTLALVAYCLILFFSSTWASDASLADVQFVEGLKSLAIFVIAASLAATWHSLRGVLAAVTLAAALLAGLTIIQFVTGTTNEFGGLASFEAAHIYEDVSEPRASGPVSDPNFYAQLLVAVIPLGAYLAWAQTGLLRRAFFAVATLVITAGMLLTYSRGAMVAMAAMVAMLFAVLHIPIRARHVALAAFAGVLLLALAPANVTHRLETFRELLPGQGDTLEPEASIEKRRLLLAVTWRMFDDHPILGVGAGNFNEFYQPYANAVGSAAPQYEEQGQKEFPHMLYLEIAAETGLLGLACFMTAMTAAFLALRRVKRELLARGDTKNAMLAVTIGLALAGYLVTSLFLHGAYQRNLWLLLAFVAALTKLAAEGYEVTGLRGYGVTSQPPPQPRNPATPQPLQGAPA